MFGGCQFPPCSLCTRCITESLHGTALLRACNAVRFCHTYRISHRKTINIRFCCFFIFSALLLHILHKFDCGEQVISNTSCTVFHCSPVRWVNESGEKQHNFVPVQLFIFVKLLSQYIISDLCLCYREPTLDQRVVPWFYFLFIFGVVCILYCDRIINSLILVLVSFISIIAVWGWGSFCPPQLKFIT